MYPNLKKLCLSIEFERFVITAVFLNAILLGAEVSLDPSSHWLEICRVIDRMFLGFFCIEISCKLFAFRKEYFTDGWRVFDFVIVFIALVPNSGPLSILRALRVLRALRMISVVPRLRQVVSGLLSSIPGLGAVGGILLLVFYISSVISTAMFGKTHSEWFGTILKSFYSLFQIMTLESWSMGIVRPIMDQYSWAALFFVPFIIITTFIILNMMIAVIVNSMQVETSETAEQHALQGQDERALLLEEIKKIQGKIETIEANLRDQVVANSMVTRHFPPEHHQSEQ